MKFLNHALAFAALLFVPVLAFANVDADFVPLTNIPGLLETGRTVVGPEGLSAFLNSIYRLCIGAAAVIAVLQIMRAGIMYMGGDSVTEKKDAKNLIALSIGGLILVLSPVIVFSIINPRILDLKIEGIDALKVDDPTGIGGGGDTDGGPEAPPPVIPATGEVNTACRVYTNGQVIPASDTTGEQCCGAQTSQYVQCNVNWNYRSQPYVKYCGCQYRGILASPLNYTYYRTFQRTCQEGAGCGFGDAVSRPAVIPRDTANVASFRQACEAAGGNPSGEDTQNDFVAFLTNKAYEACPADSGLSDTGNANQVNRCRNARYTCE